MYVCEREMDRILGFLRSVVLPTAPHHGPEVLENGRPTFPEIGRTGEREREKDVDEEKEKRGGGRKRGRERDTVIA